MIIDLFVGDVKGVLQNIELSRAVSFLDIQDVLSLSGGELLSENCGIVARFSEVSPFRPDMGIAPSTTANPRLYPRPAGAWIWASLR